MTETQRLLAVAALAYGLAYCALVAGAAIVAHDRLSLAFILGALAAAYLCFVLQLSGPDRRAVNVLIVTSWIAAVMAGLRVSGV